MDWLDLLAVQGTLKSLLQHHSSKASILQHSGEMQGRGAGAPRRAVCGTRGSLRTMPGGGSAPSLETSLFLRLPSQDGTLSLPLLSLFLSFIFFLPPFEDNGLLFWVPDVLCQHSEVVLWNLLSV